jgi:hypothetical protein
MRGDLENEIDLVPILSSREVPPVRREYAHRGDVGRAEPARRAGEGPLHRGVIDVQLAHLDDALAAHLDDALAALELQLTPEEIAALEAPYQPHEVRGHGRTM